MSEPTVFIIDDDLSARRGITRLVQAAGLKQNHLPPPQTF